MIFRGFFVKINGCRDLHLTNANVRDFSDALALRRHSELKKKENIQKGGEKMDMITLKMNNLGLNNIPIPRISPSS